MLNLELKKLIRYQTPPEGPEFKYCAFDRLSHSLYLLSHGSLFQYDFETKILKSLISGLAQEVCFFQFLSNFEVIVIGAGNVLHVYKVSNQCYHQETLDNKISAMSYNPVEDSYAIIFVDGSVMTVNFNFGSFIFHVLAKAHICDDVPEVGNVGWGDAATQFQGSERRNTGEVHVEPVLDDKPRICWRGIGEMFAINYWRNQKRSLKVFEYPCKAISESGEYPGLQPAIAWRPQGSRLTCCSLVNNTHVINFFEKNGLPFSSFVLADGLQIINVLDIRWSPCGKVLSVHCALKGGESALCLYLSTNHRWLMKQCLRFKKENPLISFTWDESVTNSSFVTLIACTQKCTAIYEFCLKVHRNANSSHCAVIAGNTLKLTLYDESIVPPPLCSRSATIAFPINFVVFHSVFSSILVIDYMDNIYSINYEKDIMDICPYKMNVNFNVFEMPLIMHGFCEYENEIIFAVYYCNNSQTYLYKDNNYNEPTPILCRGLSPFHEKYLYCKDVQLLPGEDRIYTFCLTKDNKLYMNDSFIDEDVTSFLIRSSYLLYIVSYSNESNNDRLVCALLSEDVLIDFSVETLRQHICERMVEKGAMLISTISEKPMVILQTPRGNIETVYCNMIAVDYINDCLSKKNWKRALHLIRMIGLDSNLLIDLDPTRFLNNAVHFIEACQTPSVFCQFVKEFNDYNCLKLHYKWINWEDKILPNKITVVCDRLIELLGDVFCFEDSVVCLVHVKLSHATVKSAMRYILCLVEKFHQNDNFRDIAKKCLKVFKTVNISDEDLFNTALSLYDMELISFVAASTQLDPRFYEPFIERLSKLKPIQLRYEINLHLKNYKAAASYITYLEDKNLEEIISFIDEHKVSYEVYQSMTDTSVLYKDIAKAHAVHLSRSGCLFEAAVVYTKAKLLNEAIAIYTTLLDYRKVVSLSLNSHSSPGDLQDRLDKIADKLDIIGKKEQAAEIYDLYLNNPKKAVALYVEARCFALAIDVAVKHQEQDLLNNYIPLEIQKYKDVLYAEIGTYRKEFVDQWERLKKVRNSLQKKLSTASVIDTLDVASVTTGTSSTASSFGSSSRTSRVTAKQKRKYISLRQGGPYENIALLRALHILISKIFQLGPSVKELCILLLERTDCPVEDVQNFQITLSDLHTDITALLPAIWPECLYYCPTNALDIVQRAHVLNISQLDPEYRIPPKIPVEDWKLNFSGGRSY